MCLNFIYLTPVGQYRINSYLNLCGASANSVPPRHLYCINKNVTAGESYFYWK